MRQAGRLRGLKPNNSPAGAWAQCVRQAGRFRGLAPHQPSRCLPTRLCAAHAAAALHRNGGPTLKWSHSRQSLGRREYVTAARAPQPPCSASIVQYCMRMFLQHSRPLAFGGASIWCLAQYDLKPNQHDQCTDQVFGVKQVHRAIFGTTHPCPSAPARSRLHRPQQAQETGRQSLAGRRDCLQA